MEDDGYITLSDGEVFIDQEYFRLERLVEETDDRAERRLHLSALYWHHQRRMKEAAKATQLALGVGFVASILFGTVIGVLVYGR